MQEKDKIIAQPNSGYSPTTEDGYTRLEELMAGQKPKELRRSDEIQLIGCRLILVIVLGFLYRYSARFPSSYSRKANPVAAIIVMAKGDDYLKENYPDIADDMKADVNNITSYKTGYCITFHYEDNTNSKIMLYYDKSMDFVRRSVELKSTMPIDNQQK